MQQGVFMPEVWFEIQWPDGSSNVCYSPSTAVERYFAKGQRYTIRSFLEAARPALEEASRRVEAKFGYRCSSADDQLAQIETVARRMGIDSPGEVTVLYLGRAPP
jgi:uncharacterized repeat protein (TIGR04042 family)